MSKDGTSPPLVVAAASGERKTPQPWPNLLPQTAADDHTALPGQVPDAGIRTVAPGPGAAVSDASSTSSGDKGKARPAPAAHASPPPATMQQTQPAASHTSGIGPVRPGSGPLGALQPDSAAPAALKAAFAGQSGAVASMDSDGTDGFGNTSAHWAALAGNAAFLSALSKEAVGVRNDLGATPLHAAAFRGQLAAVEALLKAGADVAAETVTGDTALHFAVWSCNGQVVQALAKAGAPLNHVNENGETPLVLATNCGAVGPVELLDQLHADWSYRIHYAARHGHALVIKDELSKAAGSSNDAATPPALDLLDQRQRTPLLQAARHGHAEAVEALLNAGASTTQVLPEGKQTPLLLAAEHGHTEVVRILLQFRADKEARDAQERTPVLAAAAGGHALTLEALIEAGADVDRADSQGDTAQHLAARLGHVAALQVLSFRCKPDMPNHQSETPLVAAINNDQAEAVKALAGANPLLRLHWAAAQGDLTLIRNTLLGQSVVNIQDGSGRTALHHAAEHGQVAVAQMLVADAHANPNISTIGTLSTPLHLAARGGNAAIVTLLLEHGADLRHTTKARRTCLHEAVAPGSSLDCIKAIVQACMALPLGPDAPSAQMHAEDEAARLAAQWRRTTLRPAGISAVGHSVHGGTIIGATMTLGDKVLQWSKEEAEAQALSLPMSRTGILNAQDEHGKTALLLASHLGLAEIVQELVQAGASIQRPDNLGWRAITCAAKKGHLKVVQLLVAAGAPLDSKGAEERTPLHLAAGYGHLDLCKYLISVKSTLEAQDAAGFTPLMLAAAGGHIDVMRYLLECGAEVNKLDHRGGTALTRLAKSMPEQALAALEVLLDAKAQIDVLDSAKMTPLIALVAVPDPTTKLSPHVPAFIRRLLQAGADITPRDQDGMTAIMHACQAGLVEAVKVLLEFGGDPNELCDSDSACLHYCMWRVMGDSPGHLEVMQLLVRVQEHYPNVQAIDINQEDWEGEVCLNYAANNNQVEAARLVLEEGCDAMHICHDGLMPLHQSAVHGSMGVLKLLLVGKWAMDKLTPTVSGRTIIHMAAGFGQMEALNFLLDDMGMDANQPSTHQVGLPPQTTWLSYPVRRLCKQYYVDIMGPVVRSCLVDEAGLHIKTAASAREEAQNRAAVRVCTPLPSDRKLVYFEVDILEGDSPCHVDIGLGQDTLEYFLRPGFSADGFSYAGDSGLAWTGAEAKVDKFGPKYSKGDTVGVVWNRSVGTCSFTLNGRYLGIASREVPKDSLSAMVAFRQAGAVLRANFGAEDFKFNMDDLMVEEEGRHNPGDKEPWRFKQKMYPIHMAACSKDIRTLQLLLDRGAVVDQVDADGWSALHFASLGNWEEGVRSLLLHKADKNRETHHMSSALLFAVKYSATAAARVLLEEGAATHTKDKDGRTLLMWASSSGNIEIMKMLIASGVSIKAKDALGKTAMQYACNEAVVDFLESYLNKILPYRVFQINLLDEVKRGAEGTVVMAKHVATGNQCAIKFHIHVEARNKSAAITARLSEKYVATIPQGLPLSEAIFDDHDYYPDYPYAMVMNGGDKDLCDLLDSAGSKGLPQNQCRYIFDSMACAVEQMHLLDLVHHDLKPKNFVRHYDGRFRLIDFDNVREAGRQEMGNTTLEICAPEMAAALLKRERLRAHPSMDIWALGCCLYNMVTNRLFLSDLMPEWKGDVYKVDSEDGLKAVAAITQARVDAVLADLVASQALMQHAGSVLGLMLQVDPRKRTSIEGVLAHTFLTGGNTLAMDEAAMKSMQNTLNEVNQKVDTVLGVCISINERTLALADLPSQLQAGLKEVEQRIRSVSKLVMDVATKGECPTTFVISPEVAPKQAVDIMGGKGSKSMLSWMSDLQEVMSGDLTMSELVKKVSNRRFRLHLCCEHCMKPVGEGYIIEKQEEWTAKLLPAFKMSLHVARAYNVAATLGRFIFPAIPAIPSDLMEAGEKLIKNLKGSSTSVEDFACIKNETLRVDGDAASQDDMHPKKQVGAALRQLGAFLRQADWAQNWGGLALVQLDAPSQGQDGTQSSCLWVCPACVACVACADGTGAQGQQHTCGQCLAHERTIADLKKQIKDLGGRPVAAASKAQPLAPAPVSTGCFGQLGRSGKIVPL